MGLSIESVSNLGIFASITNRKRFPASSNASSSKIYKLSKSDLDKNLETASGVE